MKKQSKQERIEELRNLIREKRATFDEAIEDAKFFAAGTPLPDNIQQHIQFVTAEFDSLVSLLKETAADKDLDFIEVRAEELANHRVYVSPIDDFKIEAAEDLEELSSWGVPEESLALIKKWVAKLDEKEVAEAEKRLIMLQIIEDYNHWDGYVDWVVKVTNFMRGVFSILFSLSLILSFLALSHNFPVLGFIMASISGAAISLLLKTPQVVIYKQVRTFIAESISRIATGAIVGVVGLSLLSSKIINLVLEYGEKKITIADLVCCPNDAHCAPLGPVILIGIGVLFGFSERLLSSLESTFLGKLSLPERGGKKPSEKSEA